MRVAVLGTGTMGAGMAGSLERAGHEVVVWNRTAEKAKALESTSITAAASVTDAVEGADAVVTVLFDADSVLEVSADVTAALGPDSVWIQATTVGPDGATRIAAAGQDGMLDAPVLGTKKPAQDGTLVVLASGPRALIERAQPVFDAIGTRTVVVGPEIGQASALKLACNSWIATITVATAQAVALAASLRVDPKLFLSAIEGGAVDTPYAQLKGAAMLSGDYTPSFTVDGVVKDVGLMIEAGSGADFPMDVLTAVREHFQQASADGHGDDDMAAVRFSFPPGQPPTG